MLKTKLHKHLIHLVEERILEVRNSLNSTKDGSQATSSAGDKHNTEQAMLHLEEEKKSQQLSIALNNKKLLRKFVADKLQKEVGLGSYIETNTGNFYFSIPLGKINFEEKEIMVLSLASPIGQALKGKTAGDEISFNGALWKIKNIE